MALRDLLGYIDGVTKQAQFWASASRPDSTCAKVMQSEVNNKPSLAGLVYGASPNVFLHVGPTQHVTLPADQTHPL